MSLLLLAYFIVFKISSFRYDKLDMGNWQPEDGATILKQQQQQQQQMK